MQLVIVAGGKGTRLRERTGEIPKPMVEVGGKPLLEHQILLAKAHGITDIILLTGYNPEYIEVHFGDGSRLGVNIQYRQDKTPVGTAGALINAFDLLEERFVVIYGDTMLNVDLGRMCRSFPDWAKASLFVHPNDHPIDSDLIDLNEDGEVTALHPYPHPRTGYLANLVNAALYVMQKDCLRPWYEGRGNLAYPLDLAKHVFPELLRNGVRLHGYCSREYIKDAGTAERLDRVMADFESGRIANGSLQTSLPAIFLDRDGTLNRDHGWIRSPDSLELLPTAAEAVRLINNSGYLAVLVTNQPVIARGECTEAELRLIHNKLEWMLAESHAYLDRIYYCPHHPHRGFENERAELKIPCQCRKPAPGLLARAKEEMNIDLKKSWMVGDRPEDMQAASSLGVPGVFIDGSRREKDHSGAVRRCENVLHAVRFILESEGSI